MDFDYELIFKIVSESVVVTVTIFEIYERKRKFLKIIEKVNNYNKIGQRTKSENGG